MLEIIPEQLQSCICLGAVLTRTVFCHTLCYLMKAPESIILNFQFEKALFPLTQLLTKRQMCSMHLAQQQHEQDFMWGLLRGNKDRKRSPAQDTLRKCVWTQADQPKHSHQDKNNWWKQTGCSLLAVKSCRFPYLQRNFVLHSIRVVESCWKTLNSWKWNVAA